ncbi:PD-(D/E)XK nuclease family protein [Dehalococcoidia bacterium]|nr:PD-(D/E)XK nuclease family protein [Dehalococcoidia bacterium]
MAQKRDIPYLWVTWLTKLLVGENSCEWAAWFRANHESWSYEKTPSTFDATEWQLQHTELLNKIRNQIETDGDTVFTENQNSFHLRGRTAVLGGKPDLVTVSGTTGTIFDAKTGQPSPSHHVQVMIYMYALPKAMGQYDKVIFDGKVVYPDHEDYIPNTALDDTFIENLGKLIQRMASSDPARRVPSGMECGFCNITKADCPDRIEEESSALSGETEDF